MQNYNIPLRLLLPWQQIYTNEFTKEIFPFLFSNLFPRTIFVKKEKSQKLKTKIFFFQSLLQQWKLNIIVNFIYLYIFSKILKSIEWWWRRNGKKNRCKWRVWCVKNTPGEICENSENETFYWCKTAKYFVCI